jgi:protein-S-isoprenylcysteine O-methyltransferase Ste14
MRGTNIIVLFALILVTLGLLFFAPGLRWLAVLPAIGAFFFAWRTLSSRGIREEEAHTRTQGYENRYRQTPDDHPKP